MQSQDTDFSARDWDSKRISAEAAHTAVASHSEGR